MDTDSLKILEILPFNAYWLDDSGRYLGCNRHYCNFLGIDSSETIIGQSPDDFFSLQAIVVEEGKKVKTKTSKALAFERKYIFPQQKPLYFLAYQFVLHSAEKQSKTIVVEYETTSYINEQEALQEKLDAINKEKNTAEIYLTNLVDNLPGSVYWKDKNSVILGDNIFHARIAGFNSVEEVIGKTDSDFVWKDQADSIIKNDQLVMETGEVFYFEEAALLEDKVMHFFLTSKAPLRDKNNIIIGLVGVSLDITDRKKIEEDLKKALEVAEAATRAKTDFLSNMSHDVKTPLSGMISFAELLGLRIQPVQPDAYDLAQGLMNAGKQLMHFFDNCIELSKIEIDAIVSLKENFSLKCLLHDIMQLFRPAMMAKGLFLYVDYDEKIPGHVLGNRAHLYRILLNLMGNAIKFTRQGFIKITVNLGHKSTEKNAIIQLKIKDTGVGIPEDKKQLIFEKFSRLTPSYQGTYEGHGIGLYIVQQFVEGMGGQIYVKSQEGEGSEFVLAIPFECSLLTDDECEDKVDVDLSVLQVLPQEIANPLIKNPLKEIEASVQEIPADTSNLNVLLVEDDVRAQMVARMVLETLDCHVDVADCGEKAIALFKPGKYSLVFMDIGLPDIKGYEVSKRLREMEESTVFHVPILGLSAHASQEEKQLSTDAGMEEMFSKPLLIDQAKKMLEDYVVTS